MKVWWEQLLTLALALIVTAVGQAREPELIVSAAASLADVMTELTTSYREATGVVLRVNTGGSNTLARQIVEGAPVDVFLSADQAQLDIVEAAGRTLPGSRGDLLTNVLVIVVPESSPGEVSALRNARDLAGAGVRRVAMGNPDSVPAGVYGRRWLERIGVWSAVTPKVIPLPTVRAALSAVQDGRVDAGIVYATDARATKAVRVAVTAPAGEAPAVVYPVAAIRGAHEPEALRFLNWLRDEAATRVFVNAGFGIAAAPRSRSRPAAVRQAPGAVRPLNRGAGAK